MEEHIRGELTHVGTPFGGHAWRRAVKEAAVCIKGNSEKGLRAVT